MVGVFERQLYEIQMTEVVIKTLLLPLILIIAHQIYFVALYLFVLVSDFSHNEVISIQFLTFAEKFIHIVQIEHIAVYFNRIYLLFEKSSIAPSSPASLTLSLPFFHNHSLILDILNKIMIVLPTQPDINFLLLRIFKLPQKRIILPLILSPSKKLPNRHMYQFQVKSLPPVMLLHLIVNILFIHPLLQLNRKPRCVFDVVVQFDYEVV